RPRRAGGATRRRRRAARRHRCPPQGGLLGPVCRPPRFRRAAHLPGRGPSCRPARGSARPAGRWAWPGALPRAVRGAAAGARRRRRGAGAGRGGPRGRRGADAGRAALPASSRRPHHGRAGLPMTTDPTAAGARDSGQGEPPAATVTTTREVAWTDIPELVRLENEAFPDDAWSEASWWGEL